MQKTDYRRGLKRLLLLLSFFWFAFWASNIYKTWIDQRHFYVHVWELTKGTFSFPSFTFARYRDSGVGYFLHDGDVTLDGQRYILFFRSSNPDVKARAGEYLNSIPAKDVEEIKLISANSRKFSVQENLLWMFGVPGALLVVSLLATFVYRGFRPKVTA